MKETSLIICVVLVAITMATSLANAQKKPSADPPSALSETVTNNLVTPPANQVRVLQAQHEIDTLDSQAKSLQIQSQQLYDQFMADPHVKELQKQMDTVNEKTSVARHKLDIEKSDAVKATGADPAKFELDMETLNPKAKPEPPKTPAPPTQPPPPQK